jgi:hypothetical protein
VTHILNPYTHILYALNAENHCATTPKIAENLKVEDQKHKKQQQAKPQKSVDL